MNLIFRNTSTSLKEVKEFFSLLLSVERTRSKISVYFIGYDFVKEFENKNAYYYTLYVNKKQVDWIYYPYKKVLVVKEKSEVLSNLVNGNFQLISEINETKY